MQKQHKKMAKDYNMKNKWTETLPQDVTSYRLKEYFYK